MSQSKKKTSNATRIKKNYELITKYLLKNNVPLITYNREKDSLDDLLRVIEYTNDNIEFPKSLRRNPTS